MRTETKTVAYYQLSELSEEAQQMAWENWREHAGNYWADEYRSTLEHLQGAFSFNVGDWSVDEYTYSFSRLSLNLSWSDRNNIQEIEGLPFGEVWLRLRKWIMNANDYSAYLTEGKVFAKSGKFRRSRIMKHPTETINGMCMGSSFLTKANELLSTPHSFSSLEEFISDCLNAFFDEWRSEIQYQMSFESFEEACEANEYEFLENGRMA